MLDTYRTVFAHRGALAFSATGMLARLPISMMTLGIVLLVSSVTGSYTMAGQVSAAYIVGNAVVAIPHGRLADRFGQTLVLYADAVLFALTTGLLVQAITHGWVTPWPHVMAALSGATLPQVGSMVRARWAHIVTDDTERHTAFAVEAVGDEVVFVTGPALVTFLSTLRAPQTGLVTALVVGTVGTVLLALQRRTAPAPAPAGGHDAAVSMPWRRILPIAFAAVALGCLFGALEVATVATAGHGGHKAAAGVLLAGFSLGSMVSGLVAGAVHWSAPDHRRFQVGVAALAVTMLVLPFLADLVVLGVLLFLIGLTLAPSLIAVVSLLEASTPRGRLTEAMAVFQTGISAGIAPGAYLAGVTADHTGGAASYWVCVASGAVTFGAALLCRPAPSVAEETTSLRP
ncbi:MFS family permease [Marmoricola sp. URHA0025 HA25]